MGELNSKNVELLFKEQLSNWEQARDKYQQLNKVLYKNLNVNGGDIKVQINPARIVSSGAKVDAKTIQTRKCFLCAENRPEVQKGINFIAPTGNEYVVLINPFPIFPRHLTIPDVKHTDQLLSGRYEDMLTLSDKLQDFVDRKSTRLNSSHL